MKKRSDCSQRVEGYRVIQLIGYVVFRSARNLVLLREDGFSCRSSPFDISFDFKALERIVPKVSNLHPLQVDLSRTKALDSAANPTLLTIN
jgi:hypothetical protein